jgi:hypothetical protein
MAASKKALFHLRPLEGEVLFTLHEGDQDDDEATASKGFGKKHENQIQSKDDNYVLDELTHSNETYW